MRAEHVLRVRVADEQHLLRPEPEAAKPRAHEGGVRLPETDRLRHDHDVEHSDDPVLDEDLVGGGGVVEVADEPEAVARAERREQGAVLPRQHRRARDQPHVRARQMHGRFRLHLVRTADALERAPEALPRRQLHVIVGSRAGHLLAHGEQGLPELGDSDAGHPLGEDVPEPSNGRVHGSAARLEGGETADVERDQRTEEIEEDAAIGRRHVPTGGGRSPTRRARGVPRRARPR